MYASSTDGRLIYMATTLDTPTVTEGEGTSSEFRALQTLVTVLQPLSSEARRRVLQAAATFLRIDRVPTGHSVDSTSSNQPMAPSSHRPFSEAGTMSPKEFLLEKQPRTDVERIACLAFYLTHYRDTPHFKTLELSKLNTEAAQQKFANAANATNNAVKMGYLVPSSKGQRQLGAAGEQFVRALPDRDAARAAMARLRPRRITRRSRSTRTVTGGDSLE